MLSALLLGVVLLALPANAGAIVGGAPNPTNDYVVFVGQTVHWTHPSFPSVSGPNTIPINATACTGTLVSPTVVVTAAHCSLYERPTQFGPNQPFFPAGTPFPQDAVATRVTYVVRQGDDVLPPLEPGTSFVAAPGTMHVQPGFAWGGDGLPNFSDNDLAVVKLAAPLPGPYAQLPELGASEPFSPADKLLIVGYGVSEMHGSTPVGSSFDGRRRSDTARLLGGQAIADDLLHFAGGACFGDSGGPVLSGNVLLGVISFAPSACKSTNYATRVDTADSLAFIRSFL
jgi:hypothetical protein